MIRKRRNQRQGITNVISTMAAPSEGMRLPPPPALSLPVASTSDPLGAIAREAAAGDNAAIRRLFTSIAPSLLRVIRGILGPHNADIEDVLQDSLLRVLKALSTFRGEGTVLHFASRIAVRATVDRIRRQRTRTEDLSDDQPAPSPNDHAVQARKRELLGALLASLAPEQADTLVLRAVLGHSVEEIAEMFKVPINTVRSRLRLAKENVRRRVQADPRMAELGDDNEDN